MKRKKIRQLLLSTIISCIISSSSFAQTTVKYFDSSWNTIPKDSAFYFTEIVKEGSLYRCRSYWMKSKKICYKSVFVDSLLSKQKGIMLKYYENGQIDDSTNFYDDGIIKNVHHYYPNGKLWVYYTYDENSKKTSTKAFDKKNNKIEDFIYMKEASFQESIAEWLRYLSKNVNADVPVKNGAPIGNYQVVIRFIVDKKGKVQGAYPETNLGFGMEAEALRVIQNSPEWNPAIMMGKPVNAYRKQPLTFSVTD